MNEHRCIRCGAELPAGASFCPHCESVQIEKHIITAPRPRKKQRLRRLACVLCCCALVGAAVLLLWPGKAPQTEPDGQTQTDTGVFSDHTGASYGDNSSADLLYTDGEDRFHLTAAFANFDTTPFASEPVWSADIPAGGNGGFSVKLYVTDADGVNARGSFLDKLASCSLETAPQGGAKAVETTEPAPTDDYPAAALVSGLHYDAACGTNDLIWTLEMKNGDTIRLRQRLRMNEIPVVTYTADDAPMNTVEELNALLARIEREEDSRIIVALELPPVTYTGGLRLESRAYALRGSCEGERQTTFTGTVTVGTREPFPTSITGVRFEGDGGDGLAAYEGVFLYGCEFTGWDTAALVCDGGWIGAKGCVFRGNRRALWFNNWRGYTCTSQEYTDDLFEGNGTAVDITAIPGSLRLDFTRSVFRGNTADVDNLARHPIALPEDTEAK